MTNTPAISPLRRRPTVEDLYTRGRSNSLNLIRLILAAAVIIWHTYPAAGIEYPTGGLATLLGNFPVNGFFAISGYLIYMSWARKPVVLDFLVARAVRIYPAFWACLVVTAFIVAPIAVAIQGGNAVAQAISPDSFGYVIKNATLAMLQWQINDTPTGIPYETSWNASLWTLAWEFCCYIALMILGILGLTKRKWMLPAAFAGSVLLVAVSLFPPAYIEAVARAGRFSLFFFAGALVAQYGHRIRANWAVGIIALSIAIGAAWIPGGILLQAPATAVGLLVLGGLFNPRWAELRNDISYGVYIYAFPVQQMLAVVGLTTLGLFGFSLLALVITIPLAAASWFGIEKPALKLRKKIGYPTWFRRPLPAGGAVEK